MNWLYSDFKLGDLIASLATIKAIGNGSLLLTNCNEILLASISFLLHQTYIESVIYHQDGNLCVCGAETLDLSAVNNVDSWHRNAFGRGPICDWIARAFNVKTPITDPWLTCPMKQIAPVVFNRSARYHNSDTLWRNAMVVYDDKVFVGTEAEHRAFESAFGEITYCPTPTLLDAAMVINGAELFLGNQSGLLWVAMGLGVPVVQEVYQQIPNCVIKRANVIICKDPSGMLLEWPNGITGYPTTLIP